jgi:hypothetical protein
MPMVSVRVSEEEKKRLARHGKLSDSIREAIRLYLDSEESKEVLAQLRSLQERDKVKTTPREIVRMLREDRSR